MFFDVVRILRKKRPGFVVLENVKGVLSSNNGADIEIICKALSGLGYIVNLEVYNSKDFGVPQNRERVFFICTNIHKVTNVGQAKKITTSETTVQEWLFQILLNNLDEVKGVRERESKDSVLGWLLLNEIIVGLKMKIGFSSRTKNYLSRRYPTLFQGEDILQFTINQNISVLKEKREEATILTVLDEKSSTLDMGLVWQNIDILLKRYWEENYLGKNKYTISTAIKQITEWKTFTYSKMLLSILTLTVQLRNSSKSLWNEILSSLIVIQEDTNYARIRKITKEEVISESDTHYSTEVLINRDTVFVIRCPGRFPRSKVFPLRENDQIPDEQTIEERVQQNAHCLRGRDYANWNGNFIARCLTGGGKSGGLHSDMTLLRAGSVGSGNSQTSRVYDPAGLSRCLKSSSGGWGNATGLYCISDSGLHRTPQVRTDTVPPLRANIGCSHNNVIVHNMHPRCGDPVRGGTGHLSKDDGNSYCLDNNPQVIEAPHSQIRRLTPLEAERLQGFEDGWTAGVADSHRYRLLGNAVTVPVISAIMEKIVKVKGWGHSVSES